MFMKRRIRRPKNERDRKNYTLIIVMLVAGFSLGYSITALPLAHKLDNELPDGYHYGVWPWDWFRSDGYDYYKGSGRFGTGQGSDTDNNGQGNENGKNSVLKDGSDDASKKWNIGFTDAVKTASVGSASEAIKPKVSKENVEFGVSLMEPGDSITYTVTIKNMGIIDAKVSNIKTTYNNGDSDAIIFKIEGIQVGDELDAGKTKKVKITAMFDENYTTMPASTVKTLSMKIDYVQK